MFLDNYPSHGLVYSAKDKEKYGKYYGCEEDQRKNEHIAFARMIRSVLRGSRFRQLLRRSDKLCFTTGTPAYVFHGDFVVCSQVDIVATLN